MRTYTALGVRFGRVTMVGVPEAGDELVAAGATDDCSTVPFSGIPDAVSWRPALVAATGAAVWPLALLLEEADGDAAYSERARLPLSDRSLVTTTSLLLGVGARTPTEEAEAEVLPAVAPPVPAVPLEPAGVRPLLVLSAREVSWAALERLLLEVDVGWSDCLPALDCLNEPALVAAGGGACCSGVEEPLGATTVSGCAAGIRG